MDRLDKQSSLFTGEAEPALTRVTRKPGGADPFVPKRRISLPQLERAANLCRGCDLYKHAIQAVLGEFKSPPRNGTFPKSGVLMLIGEQPGDQEDLQGHPFVGPAGKVLDKAMDEAGLNLKKVFLTNAVKHFKWTPAPRGKRRLHSKPSIAEIRACWPWLEAEIGLVKPEVIVCLGASAGTSLFGSKFRVGQTRGTLIPGTWAGWTCNVTAAQHPSAILRAPDSEARRTQYNDLVNDLRYANASLKPGALRSR